MLNGMRRKQMILESLKADQILTRKHRRRLMLAFRPLSVSEPGHCEELQEYSKSMGKCWLICPLKWNAWVVVICSWTHCMPPFHLKESLPKLTLSKKKNTERWDFFPTLHFSLLKGQHLRIPLSSLKAFRLAVQPMFVWGSEIVDPMVSPKKHLGDDKSDRFPGREITPNGEAPYLEFIGVWEVFCVAPPKQKEANKERWEIDSIRMVRVKKTLSLTQRPLVWGGWKTCLFSDFLFQSRFQRRSNRIHSSKKGSKRLFQISDWTFPFSASKRGVLVVSDFLWRSVVQQGWVLGLDLVLYKKRCLFSATMNFVGKPISGANC